MKIGYLVRTDGACDYYRAVLPIETMIHADNSVKAESFTKMNDYSRLLKIVEQADIMVIPRVVEDKFVELFFELQKQGKKCVVDHDDFMFDLSPLSNHYAEFGCKEVQVKYPDGSVGDLWKDGEGGFDLQANLKRLKAAENALSVADMVTVTTPILKEAYSKYNDNVVVLPNCIDIKLWGKLPLQKRGDVRIGWFGGSSHYEDLLLIREVLPHVLERYPQVRIVFMGQEFGDIKKVLPEDRYEFHSWCPTPAYPYKSAILDLDISVIPLQENFFNSCKSPIKFIEQGALHVPCVVSHVSPYKEVYNGNNMISVDNDFDSWVDGITELINDVDLRKKIGGSAYRTVVNNFDINKEYVLWKKAYKELLND